MSSLLHSLSVGILFNSNALGIHLCKALQPKATCKRRQQLPTLLLFWQWWANGCNNSQQRWDLQCIVGRIQPKKTLETMCIALAWPQQCWTSCANGSSIVALRFGDHGTKEMLGMSCWFESLTSFKLCKTTPNNMQQGGEKT